MQNIFKDFANYCKLIRVLNKIKPGEIMGRSAVENILEAQKGSNCMHTIGGITNTTTGNIDELMKKAYSRVNPNVKITGVIVFMDDGPKRLSL